ncbi:HAD family hydrolase [Flavobacterium sp. 7A]|uniref:HAD family hydrolase n=1 Tax=Flavobacterium sp. 7A TaxID=2940571 RepID=UPI002227D3A8|nr:HAD family hydrolase [Flavobacterium sp. 7A]MCW2121022.1 HAD superfamily hydrolase (TIGR01509 family) [Flavobacterium sp. 7A]
MKYKCIIFDCDGVLVDSESITNLTLIELAKTVGVTMTEKFVMNHFLGKSLAFCFNYIQSQTTQKLPTNFEAEFRERTFQAFKTHLQPIAGVHELLDKLKIDFCVASNGPREKIRLNLTTANLIDKFEGKIFSAYDINSWKPNPELYLHVAKTMGYKVADCVVIEDSPAGAQAALSGGFAVYGYLNSHNKTEFAHMKIPVFEDMKNLDLLLS